MKYEAPSWLELYTKARRLIFPNEDGSTLIGVASLASLAGAVNTGLMIGGAMCLILVLATFAPSVNSVLFLLIYIALLFGMAISSTIVYFGLRKLVNQYISGDISVELETYTGSIYAYASVFFILSPTVMNGFGFVESFVRLGLATPFFGLVSIVFGKCITMFIHDIEPSPEECLEQELYMYDKCKSAEKIINRQVSRLPMVDVEINFVKREVFISDELLEQASMSTVGSADNENCDIDGVGENVCQSREI